VAVEEPDAVAGRVGVGEVQVDAVVVEPEVPAAELLEERLRGVAEEALLAVGTVQAVEADLPGTSTGSCLLGPDCNV
jgi:hypothetical protein